MPFVCQAGSINRMIHDISAICSGTKLWKQLDVIAPLWATLKFSCFVSWLSVTSTHLSTKLICLSPNGVCFHLSLICFGDLISFSDHPLSLYSLCGLQSLLRYNRSAMTDACESLQHGLCVQTSPSRAIMSFSAQDFPWNNKVAWQIVARGDDDWMLRFLAASLLLSADWSEVMWSATCLEVGTGSSFSRIAWKIQQQKKKQDVQLLAWSCSLTCISGINICSWGNMRQEPQCSMLA